MKHLVNENTLAKAHIYQHCGLKSGSLRLSSVFINMHSTVHLNEVSAYCQQYCSYSSVAIIISTACSAPHHDSDSLISDI